MDRKLTEVYLHDAWNDGDHAKALTESAEHAFKGGRDEEAIGHLQRILDGSLMHRVELAIDAIRRAAPSEGSLTAAVRALLPDVDWSLYDLPGGGPAEWVHEALRTGEVDPATVAEKVRRDLARVPR